jgi:hypothetical protein
MGRECGIFPFELRFQSEKRQTLPRRQAHHDLLPGGVLPDVYTTYERLAQNGSHLASMEHAASMGGQHPATLISWSPISVLILSDAARPERPVG